jgi:hypothetical protein
MKLLASMIIDHNFKKAEWEKLFKK